MSDRARNVAIGLTVLVALVLLGGMIVLFAGVPEIFQRGQILHLRFGNTGDVHEGDPVHLDGKTVGLVTGIGFVDNDARKGIQVNVRIDPGVRVPANVRVEIISRSFGGGVLELATGGPPRRDPKTGKALDFLPPDWTEPLAGTIRSSSLIPPEFTSALGDLSKLAASLNKVLVPPEANAPPQLDQRTLAGALGRLSRALDDVHAVLGNPDNQANVRNTLANLAAATGKASQAIDDFKAVMGSAEATFARARGALEGADKAFAQVRTSVAEAGRKFADLTDNTDRRIGEIARQLVTDADQVSRTLAAIRQVFEKASSGEGTLGKLMNDPKLYNDLTEAADELTRLLVKVRQFVAQAEKSGLPLKLK